jgi:ribosomal protein S18 acetylase RimI-like enzyme
VAGISAIAQRQKNAINISTTTMQLPLYKTLKNGASVELDIMRPEEQETVRALLNLFVAEGLTYPQAQPLSEAEFAAYWMSRDAFVVRTVGQTVHNTSEAEKTEILGAFYLKPNFPGRCSHICNAGFIVQPAMRGQGIGRWMGEAMLAIAPTKGYSAIMFNLVFATNTPSLNLWQSLGFTTLGRIPNAAHLADGQTVDAFMLYYALEP